MCRIFPCPDCGSTELIDGAGTKHNPGCGLDAAMTRLLRTDRAFLLQTLQEALKEAAAQLREHNNEYEHVTPEGSIKRFEGLAQIKLEPRSTEDAIESFVHGLFEHLDPRNDKDGVFMEVEKQLKSFVERLGVR